MFTKKKKNLEQVFVTLSIHKPSLGSCEVPHKIWAWPVLTFFGHKQTDKQSLYIA